MFAQHISIKLDNNNFLSWKQPLEGIIRIHKLHQHLVNLVIPPCYLTTDDRASDVENPAYLLWHQEDSFLFIWLFTTLSNIIIPCVGKCVHAHEVWYVIYQFQRTQIYVKSNQLLYELCSMEKGGRIILQYLSCIQQIADIPESIVDQVFHRDQLETIVDELPPEYQVLALIIKCHDELCAFVVVETMFLSHEARLERAPCAVIGHYFYLNFAMHSVLISQFGNTLV